MSVVQYSYETNRFIDLCEADCTNKILEEAKSKYTLLDIIKMMYRDMSDIKRKNGYMQEYSSMSFSLPGCPVLEMEYNNNIRDANPDIDTISKDIFVKFVKIVGDDRFTKILLAAMYKSKVTPNGWRLKLSDFNPTTIDETEIYPDMDITASIYRVKIYVSHSLVTGKLQFWTRLFITYSYIDDSGHTYSIDIDSAVDYRLAQSIDLNFRVM